MKSYEDLGFEDFNYLSPVLLEAYAGADIAQWWGNILRQLRDMKQKAEDVNNSEYASHLGNFIRTWEENEITGSINIEDVEALKIAADWASRLPWNFSNYFATLTNWLRRLKASVEELPVTPVDVDDTKSVRPTAGLNADSDVPAPQFGPEEDEGDLELSADEKLNAEGDEDRIAQDIEAALNPPK